MEAMTGDRAPAPPPPVPADADDSGDEDEDEIETLRRQVRELSRQVARLTGARTKRGD
jgi:hypothetical protein